MTHSEPCSTAVSRLNQSVSRLRANAAFACGTLFFGYAFVQRVAPGVMTEELMRDFSVGAGALGVLSAFYFYAYASIQLPVGLLMDRYGPRKLMSFTVGLCAIASLGMAYSNSLLVASVCRALIGATVAFGFVGTLTISSYWFSPSRFAMLAGIIQTVGMLGAVVGLAPVRIMVENSGWRGSLLVMAVAAMVLSVLLFVVIPRRPDALRASGNADSPMAGLKAVIRNSQSWYCCGIGFGLTSVMLGFVSLWAVPWLYSVHGISKTEAAGIASFLFIGWAIAAPVFGWLSDHIQRRKPIMLAGILLNIVFFSLILFGENNDTLVFSILFFLCGISGSTMTISFGSVREVNIAKHGSTSLGLLNMFVVGSGAAMQPLIGWLLDVQWSGELIDGARVYGAETYLRAFLVLLAANVMALVCCLMLKETYCRPARDTT